MLKLDLAGPFLVRMWSCFAVICVYIYILYIYRFAREDFLMQ